MPPVEPAQLARLLFDAMSDKQVEDLVILDLRPVSLVADFFVIGTADNPRQVHAVIDAIAERARADADVRPVLVEGEASSGWVLVDFGDVVAHVLDAERRAYYRLEAIWADAPLVARMA
jgi:ribosome-associated protein